MDKSRTYSALNRLLTVVSRSLPVYLSYTSPWTRPDEAEALATLKRIAQESEQLANRVAEYTNEHYGPPDLGEYPIDFFDTHDLALEYLLKKVLACQKADVTALERLVGELSDDRRAAAL